MGCKAITVIAAAARSWYYEPLRHKQLSYTQPAVLGYARSPLPETIMRQSPQSPSPSFALSRAGFVQPGEVRAEDDAAVAAWLARLDAGPRAGGDASGAAVFREAPAGAVFVRAD